MTAPVPLHPAVAAVADEMVALRRTLHALPELGFEEFETTKRVIA